MNLLMSRSCNEEEGDAVIVYDEQEVSNWWENQKLWRSVGNSIGNFRGANLLISTRYWKRLKDV